MSETVKVLIKCLFLVVWFVQYSCESYNDQKPKIKTSDGDLIIEAAYDKNIYLRTFGPKSNIFIGGYSFVNMTNSVRNAQELPQSLSGDDLRESMGVALQGILRRLNNLENQNTTSLTSTLRINRLDRRISRLARTVLNIQNQINTITQQKCVSNPCINGGTCLDLAYGYHCLCPPNWEGKNCDIDVNECRNFVGTDLGCQNGATCINKPGSYECLCTTGWFGLHCTSKAKKCSAGDYEMCGHGICVPIDTREGITCICNQGWTTNGTGVACLTDINECDPSQGARCSINPRVECINLPGTFRCGQCPTGYEGDGYVCSDINECVTIPNGGCSPLVTCHNTIGSRICGSCPPGYQGDGVTCSWRGSCNINHGGCHPSAQCVDNPALEGQSAQCICPDGMVGDGVGVNGCYVSTGNKTTQNCDSNPCGEHGRCHPLRKGYTCLCYTGYSGAHCDLVTDYCANNPCRNGGTCRPDETSTTGFRCECTAQYSGNLCQQTSKSCSGLLVAEEGSIVYPLSNTTYNHNARCAWIIRTTSDKVINVTFSKFNLEFGPDCVYDFLQIHDGRSSAGQLIGRFCGNEFPNGGNIISSHNNLYLWFHSDNNVANDGFALHWTSIKPVCGGELDASTHGYIRSPGSPGKYPPNRDCYWHLRTTLGKRIQLHFYALDIEAHSNCSFDYLAIYDGERSDDPLIEKYCNSTQPAPIQSASSDMLIHFHSDAYSSGYGFQISYAPIEGVPGCGGFFTADKGEINSPSYEGKYLQNLLCEYKIKTSPDTKIQLNFKAFDIEFSSRCRYDYLKVYDGPSANSRLVGRFCGTRTPKFYISSGNTLYLKFKSDHSVSMAGFRLTYEALCQQTILGDSGIIKSPGYPFAYPANRICEYIISSTPGKAIQLTFQDFDIEDNRYNECQYDNVEIRDGLNSNATLLGKYCGGAGHIPPMQISTYNYMYIRFTSDMSISGTGFYANYTTIDTECGGIYRETTGLINHPSDSSQTYNNDQSCTWVLIAPEGYHIKLTWNKFDLEGIHRCSADYVEIIEIDNENNTNVFGKYCGNTPPPALTTSSNHILIKFESDSSVRSEGFSLSYSFLDDKVYCGGMYVKSHGFIYSPNWPKPYGPNRDCQWILTAPVGQQILLKITDFSLERPVRGKCDLGDYLEIRNGLSETSALIDKICGSFASRRIISSANSLFIRFHSDFYLSGNGFKIEWDGTIKGCGGTLTSPSGSISSPNYPLDYNNDAECFYRIVTNRGTRIKIAFVDLDLERTHHCRDDYVEIFDGRDTNAASLGRYCKMSPELSNIETTSNYAFIKFRSDYVVGGKGFLFNYETICQYNITGAYGIIESPGYPNNYPTNLNCLWTITVPKGNRINVTFTDFDIVSHRLYRLWMNNRSNCHSDYLQMRESVKIDFSNKICGNTAPSPFTTKGNTLQIKFMTGFYNSRKGFQLHWVGYGCGGHILKRHGSITLNGTLLNSVGELECHWLIETPLGTGITISFTDVYMVDSQNCTTDAIEAYNGENTASPLLSKICKRGNAVLQSTSNFMLVRFMKQSSLKDIHFTAQFLSYPAQCGGTIRSVSGYIYSKNYPKNYDNNLNCIWTIRVPINHRIELNFEDLDLYSEYSDYDNEEVSCQDNIKVYDGDNILHNNNYSHLICPGSNISQVISRSNVLNVQFTSDSSGVAKGFKVNFTITCGATITATRDGIITYDKTVGNHNKNCTWTIVSDKLYQKISLTITYMNLPKNNDIVTNRSCSGSFLRVFDGDDVNAPMVDEYCGRKAPPMIVSRGSAITIQLASYNNSQLGAFSAHYSSLASNCGGALSSEEGSIASPNYPRPYPVNADCEWVLKTSPGNKVYIIFETFDLEESENCNEDYLEIRENNGAGRLLDVYCGNTVPINTTIASKLYIKFHSDNKNAGQGFLLHYGFVHGNEISGLDSGEIASPLFPYTFEGEGEYTWRVVVSGSDKIIVTMDRLEIHTHGSSCSNYLIFYDGYDEEAPILDKMCGFLNKDRKIIQTSSNSLFIKLYLDELNSGSLFHMTWSKLLKNTDTDNDIRCGLNETKLIEPGGKFVFNSPNYPNEYGDDLNCEWVFKASPGRHLRLSFDFIRLEERSNCFADYISVYSADKPGEWKPVATGICLSEYTERLINSSSYMKVTFTTDSSITDKGFVAQVISVCGGPISASSGVIGPTWSEIPKVNGVSMECEWTLKVRPGHFIKAQFEHFNITNKVDQCFTFVTIRNGESQESPLLSNGKYCALQENSQEIMSSGNSLSVKYVNTNIARLRSFQTFRLWFEEKNQECGSTSTLDSEHNWEVISTPNYPSIPNSYSECVWKISGPPGEVLRIDFIDRFDVKNTADCVQEFVEIRDGSSDVARLKGRFCGEKPGTIKTSSNEVYIKYLTMLEVPNDGFKVNVSIDVCGGTIVGSSGEVSSPYYPRMPLMAHGTVCEWKIIGRIGFILKFKLQDANLPDSESSCGTKITVEDSLLINNTAEILKTICSDDIEEDKSEIVTSANVATIKLHIGEPSQWSHISETRGFRFTFDSFIPRCGDTITTPEGYLMTPGYPRETSIKQCQWFIHVPNRDRRIRLEFIDADTDKHTISISNDQGFQSIVQYPLDYNSSIPNVFESSGNILAVYVWINNRGATQHRFKAKFTSNDAAICGGSLSSKSGELISPTIDSYSCNWYYDYKPDDADDNSYNTILVRAKLNSSIHRGWCRYYDPQVRIESSLGMGKQFSRRFCGNIEESVRIPSSVMNLKAVKSKNSSPLYFNIQWEMQPCGGTVHVSEDPVNILNLPNNYNSSIDCAWVVTAPTNNKMELKLEGSFQLECTDEFVTVSDFMSMPFIGNFCKDRTLENTITTTFSNIYVQYHSKAKALNSSIKLTVKTANDQCGGIVSKYSRTFSSPNYPKNYNSSQECVWHIEADVGYRVSLNFIDRFIVEDRPNCTKDVVIIYDWKNETYTEIARVCGRQLPPSFNSTFNRMKVVFRTDSEINLEGFKARWIPICGGKFIATDEKQYLFSPGYPNKYSGLLNCTYELSAPNKKLHVEFLDFNLEGSYPSCQLDNLTILASSDYNYLSAIYCDSEMPPTYHTFETMTLNFMTDRFVQRKGFKLSYSNYNCGGQVRTPTVLSSGSSGKYEDNTQCTWYIEAPANKKVVLKFLYINLESTYSCYSDYVAVYDGSKTDESKRLALLCGHVNTTTFLRSTNNTMVLEFITDSDRNDRGFKVEVYFSYSESAGCGGQIDVSATSSKIIKSPLIGNSAIYENFLDCFWSVKAPSDYVIKIEFTSFHISPCHNINQTALGYSKCNCDYLEIKDGLNLNSVVIGTYCGHTYPPTLISTGNVMGLRLSTDGEIVSSGFEATLTAQRSLCGQTRFLMTSKISSQYIKSPNYGTGSVPRGIHCAYYVTTDYNTYATTRFTVKNLDLNECAKDKLTIMKLTHANNITHNEDFVVNRQSDPFSLSLNFYDHYYSFPDKVELCGSKKSIDIYFTGDVVIYLKTSPESDSIKRGFEIEIENAGFCGTNHTGTQGRLQSNFDYNYQSESSDCYTLITAPENHTISLYFITISPSYSGRPTILEIFDGDNVNAKSLANVTSDYYDNLALFSNGRYLLLHSVFGEIPITFDANFIATDQGRGCGGKLYNEIGTITSPLYPEIYRRKATCAWELETPENTRLLLHFKVFDLGRVCDQNYLQLVDRNGNVISTYCSELPADYTSTDNYIKVVFVTTMNNGGTGWVASFVGLNKAVP